MNMGIFNTKLSDNGQVTIPAEVMELLKLEPGSGLQFRTYEDGTVHILAKKRGAQGLKGIFGRPAEPVDVDAAIAAEVWERNRPGGSGSRS